MLVVLEFLAHFVDENASQANAENGGGYGDHEHIQHGDVVRLQNDQRRYHGGCDRAGHNGKLRGDDGHGQRALGPHAVAAGHFGNDGQHRVGHVFGVLAQNARGQPDHQVQPACGLHGGGGADHGHDHQHHVDGRAGGLELEAEGQHGQAQPPKDAQADAASLRTHQNAQQNNDKLNNKQRGHDVSKLSTTASAHLRANYRYTECINGPHFPRTP